jgi:hypothetical protein
MHATIFASKAMIVQVPAGCFAVVAVLVIVIGFALFTS